jgi:pimeloyl-ACP methyl ester carboxylesterase
MSGGIAGEVAAWREGGERYVHVRDGRGHSIFFRRGGHGGDGDTLLCIHGFPTSSFDWQPLWEQLCARFALVVAPDLIGLGWSDKPARYDYAVVDQAEVVSGLLRSLGVARTHVLAHDYGDSVAQELLARQAECGVALASVCFLNGGLFPEMHRPLLAQRLLATPILGPLVARRIGRRRFGAGLRRVFGARTRPSRELTDALWSIAHHEQGERRFPQLLGYMKERRIHRARWVGAITQASVPLRLIDGSADPVSGAHLAVRYRELVPQADCVELAGIGHYPQLEATDAVAKAYFDFLDAR